MVIFIFLVRKYLFCVNLIQKFKRDILRWNLVPNLDCLIDVPPLINSSIFLEEANLLPIIDLTWQVIECLLMFLLNVWLDITDELNVFYRSFATLNTSASLDSILTYQIKFLPPHPQLLNFQFSNPSPLPPPFISTPFY